MGMKRFPRVRLAGACQRSRIRVEWPGSAMRVHQDSSMRAWDKAGDICEAQGHTVYGTISNCRRTTVAADSHAAVAGLGPGRGRGSTVRGRKWPLGITAWYRGALL